MQFYMPCFLGVSSFFVGGVQGRVGGVGGKGERAQQRGSVIWVVMRGVRAFGSAVRDGGVDGKPSESCVRSDLTLYDRADGYLIVASSIGTSIMYTTVTGSQGFASLNTIS